MTSWVALLVAAGVVLGAGPRGRPAVRAASDRPTRRDSAPRRRVPWPRRRGGAARPDLATVAVEVAGRLRAGADPAAAWEAVLGVRLAPGAVPSVRDLGAVTTDRSEAAVVVAAGRLAAELGAPLAPLLDGVARELAVEAELEGDRRAALAGPRASGRVLTWLPVLGVVLGTAVGADPVAVLLDRGIGSAALGLGALLLWVGRLWTRRLAASAAAAGRGR